MKKITKELTAFFFVLCILLESNIIAYSETSSEKQWLSGDDFSYGMEMYDHDITKRCGNMRLNESMGILKISGTFIPNYDSGGAAPWAGCINDKYLGPLVKIVWISEGINSIGSYAFNTEGIARQSNKNIRKIYIPTTVVKIGERALRACDIYFYGDKVEIASNAIPGDAIIHGNIGSDAEKFAKTKKIEFVPLCQDDYYTIVNQKEATCTEDGYTGDKILPCIMLKELGEIVRASGHDFSEWAITKAPTHTEKGEKTRYCSKCDAYETAEIDVLAHEYKSVITAPTCTKIGYTTYTCSCGDTYNADYVEALGHSFGELAVTTPATCKAEGVETITCSRCKATETRKIEKTAHSYTAQGYTLHKCSVCADSYKDTYVNATGHCHTATVVAPTCTANGYTTYTCSCGDTYTSNYVSATGHIDGEWKVTKPATSKETGIKTLYCSVCGEGIKTEVISKLTPVTRKVKSVSLGNDIELNYKDSVKLNPKIEADIGVKYTVEYKSSDNSVVTVDKNGNVKGTKAWTKKSATITCTVIDEYGNKVSDTCNITVGYTWWQWIIGIVLFGWIWYY